MKYLLGKAFKKTAKSPFDKSLATKSICIYKMYLFIYVLYIYK